MIENFKQKIKSVIDKIFEQISYKLDLTQYMATIDMINIT